MTFFLQMPWRSRVGLALLLWLLVESAVLALVVHAVGVSGALLLGLASSLLGAAMLKRLGRSALAGLQRSARYGGVATLRGPTAIDGVLEGFGAVLLLLPGFLSDLVGLALSAAPVRRWLSRQLPGRAFEAGQGRGQPRHIPDMIDLGPEDWRPVEVRRPAPEG